MIEEKIVISDTNILFDLMSVGLLDILFELPCEILTSDFVIDEIKQPEQRKLINGYVDSAKLRVRQFDFDEILLLNSMSEQSGSNVSMADCSVWYCAKIYNGRLLTGDAKLKRVASKDNVHVSGIIYIIENFIEYGYMDCYVGAEKLERLLDVNKRLPSSEFEKRIKEWRQR